MKNIPGKIFIFLTLLFFAADFRAQLTVSAPPQTVCPGQVISLTAQWPNVSIISLSITVPPGGSATNGGNLGNNPSFTVSATNTGFQNFTLVGAGTDINGPVTGTVVFQLNVQNPAPLTIGNQIDYCPGTSATLVAQAGGSSYNITGPGYNVSNLPSNIITIPNLGPGNSGTYTITSVGACTVSGTTQINVGPNNQIIVNTTSNVCQGASVNLNAALIGGGNWAWTHLGVTVSNAPNWQINNITPSQGGAYFVSASYVVNGNPNATCTRTNVVQVNVVQTSPVSVAASPANIVCQGDKMGLSAAAGSNPVGYQWVGPAGFGPVSIANPTINPVGPNNAGVYTVTAFFTNNFITCPINNTISVQIVPVAAPVINMPSNVCQNAQVNLTASAGANVIGWEWFGPSYSSNLQTNTIDSIQPNRSGTYYVIAKYGIGTTTCAVTSAPHQLNVVQVNTVSVIPPQQVCQPNHGYLQSNATGANSYTWTGPNGFGAPGSNAVVYYPTPAASGIYTVTAFFGGGNISCPSSNTVQLIVNPVLTFKLESKYERCFNDTLTIFGPDGASSYSWTSSTGLTSNSKDIYFPSVQPKNAGTYTVNVSLGPCITSGSTTVVVRTPISWTLTPKSRTVCKGDTVVLEAGVTGGSDAIGFKWNPGVYLNTPIGSFQKFVPQGSVQYNLIAWDMACPAYSLGHSFDITVNTAPKSQLQLPVSQGCAPFCMDYFADPIGGDVGIITYDFGGLRQYQRDTLNNFCLDAGTYSLTVHIKGTNGCLESFPYPYPIIVHERPAPSISWSPETPTTSDEVVFNASYKNGPPAYSNWVFSGGLPVGVVDSLLPVPGADTTNERNPVRKYESFGKYPVMIISRDANECIDTVVAFVDIIDDMQVFIPNSFTPNGDGINDRFGVKGQGMKADAFSMELFDRWGTSIYFTNDINAHWDGTKDGTKAKDDVYSYRIRVVGMNGEGRREYYGHFSLIK